MAQRHESALRQHRRSLVSRERNRRNLAKLRTGIKKLRMLLEDGKKASESKELLNPTLSLIDHSVSKKILHRNAASRLKSRLTRQVNRTAAPAA